MGRTAFRGLMYLGVLTFLRRGEGRDWGFVGSAQPVFILLRHNGWPVLNEVIYSSTQVNDKVSGALLYWRSVRHETARECLKIAALRCKLDRAWQNPS